MAALLFAIVVIVYQAQALVEQDAFKVAPGIPPDEAKQQYELAKLAAEIRQLCDLRNADLTGAKLAGASFDGAKVHGAKLDGAQLQGIQEGLVDVSTDGTSGPTLSVAEWLSRQETMPAERGTMN